MSFSAMKNRSTNSFDDLQKELEAQDKGKQDFSDDRFWYPELDKEGAAQSIIRFLPCAEGDELPMMKFFSHSKKFSGGWFIEECPTTIGGECPMCAENDVLWNSGDAGKVAVRDNRKRKMRYVANIVVIKDPKNPENEGKRFLFQFGFKIHAKLMEAMKGTVDELEPENSIAPCNVFDFWQGKNFSLKIAKVDGQTNYDKSSFSDKVTPFHTFENGKPVKWDDAKLEELWNSQHKLKADYADKIVYKEFDKIKERLDKVQGRTVAKPSAGQSAEGMADAGGSIEQGTSGTSNIDAGTTAQASDQTEDDFFENL